MKNWSQILLHCILTINAHPDQSWWILQRFGQFKAMRRARAIGKAWSLPPLVLAYSDGSKKTQDNHQDITEDNPAKEDVSLICIGKTRVPLGCVNLIYLITLRIAINCQAGYQSCIHSRRGLNIKYAISMSNEILGRILTQKVGGHRT